MAAAVVAVRGKSLKSRSPRRRDESPEPAFQLPPIAKRKMDLDVSTLLNGTWQKRRVVYSTNEIFFLLVDDESVNIRDYVPMQDVEAVEFMDTEELSQGSLGDLPNSWRRQSHEKPLNQSTSSLRNTRFQVRTIPNGFNSGRTYYFKAQTAELCNQVVEDLRKYSEETRKTLEVKSKFKESQKAVSRIYNSTIFQGTSSVVILLNFCICIATAELGLEHIDHTNQTSNINLETIGHSFEELDFFFVTIFALELVVNAYAHWWNRFVHNGWSIFDFIVVFLSILGLAPIGIPLSLLLLLRSCRVLRIFGKLKAFSKIFAALAMSILPMGNVFFIIFIIACIYATAGVSFFFNTDPDNFSTFGSAFIAMFNITVGSIDWWFEKFPAVHEDGSFNWFPTIFLISYIVLVVWVFFQVSIAVLLDNFLAASSDLQERELLQSRKHIKQFRNPLDPLLLRLAKDYCNEADLSNRIQEIFSALDTDGSGDLSSEEFQAAVKNLDFNPPIFVSDSDFISITHNGALCNEQGHIGPKEFEKVVLEQLRLYSLARLSTSSDRWRATEDEFTTIGSLKQILMEQLRMRKDIAEILDRLPPRSQNSCGNSCRDQNSPEMYCKSEHSTSASKMLWHGNCSSEVKLAPLKVRNLLDRNLSSEAANNPFHEKATERVFSGLTNTAKLTIDSSAHACIDPEIPVTRDFSVSKDGASRSLISTIDPLQKQASNDALVTLHNNTNPEIYHSTPLGPSGESAGRLTNLKFPQEMIQFKTSHGIHSKEPSETSKKGFRANVIKSSLLSPITSVPTSTGWGEELSGSFRESSTSRLSYLDEDALRDVLVTADVCRLPEKSAVRVEENGPRVLLL